MIDEKVEDIPSTLATIIRWERWVHSFNHGNNQRSCGMGSSSSWLVLAMRRGRGTPWRGRAGWEEQPTWNMRDLIKIIFDFQGEWSCWLPTWRTWQPGRRAKRATAITADLHHTTQVQMLLSLCLIVLSFLFETSKVSFSSKVCSPAVPLLWPTFTSTRTTVPCPLQHRHLSSTWGDHFSKPCRLSKASNRKTDGRDGKSFCQMRELLRQIQRVEQLSPAIHWHGNLSYSDMGRDLLVKNNNSITKNS